MTCSRFRVLARSYATQEAHSIHSPMYDPGLFISIPGSCALSSYPVSIPLSFLSSHEFPTLSTLSYSLCSSTISLLSPRRRSFFCPSIGRNSPIASSVRSLPRVA